VFEYPPIASSLHAIVEDARRWQLLTQRGRTQNAMCYWPKLTPAYTRTLMHDRTITGLRFGLKCCAKDFFRMDRLYARR